MLALSLLAAGQPAVDCRLEDDANAIVLNQTGFETFGPKLAILRAAADTPLPWTLHDADGELLLAGQSDPAGFDESAGESVHRIEFSRFARTGTGYTVRACDISSRAFAIGEQDYQRLAEDSLRYFYLNRLAIDLEPEFTGGEAWARAGGFYNNVVTCFSGQDLDGTEWPGCDYRLDTTGGWGDAGDYGQYVVNGGISVWTLQHAYERLQVRGLLEPSGWDGHRLALPDAGDGISAILAEARWHLEFMLAMQIPDGNRVWVDRRPADSEIVQLTEIDGSGLVHHKQHERHWLPLPILPEDAEETRDLLPPSTAATLNLAATAAQCARLWRDLDAVFSERCLAAARRAFSAALREPAVFAHGNFDGGGAYGDRVVIDEFYWAAVELFLTTGEQTYRDAAQALRAQLDGRRAIFWGNTELLPELSLVLAGPDHPDFAAAATTIERQAADYWSAMEATGYLYPLLLSETTWGSNANLLNRALILATAADLEPTSGYRDGVVHAMDYLLGRNPLDQSYIAGHGARPMRFPHHRFWANGADPEFPEAPPGALSGGPNAFSMVDSVARQMEGNCAPQKCWADHVDAYALNEVAINWNSPLFAVAVYLETTRIEDQ